MCKAPIASHHPYAVASATIRLSHSHALLRVRSATPVAVQPRCPPSSHPLGSSSTVTVSTVIGSVGQPPRILADQSAPHERQAYQAITALLPSIAGTTVEQVGHVKWPSAIEVPNFMHVPMATGVPASVRADATAIGNLRGTPVRRTSRGAETFRQADATARSKPAGLAGFP